MFGYKCTLQTDTEVLTYILDYLVRVQGLTLSEAANVIAAPFLEHDREGERQGGTPETGFPAHHVPQSAGNGSLLHRARFTGGIMALNDRLKLRSMVVGEKEDLVFIASEEAAIRAMEPDAKNIWAPAGGEPVIVRVKEGAF
jgi:glutamate synthase domain-containing protein 1